MLLPVALGLLLTAVDPAPLPSVPPGWTIAVVAEAPTILYPTAVVAAPDGTVYLGQDPMDMPGPPTSPIDSIVAIKGGKITVFADHLWSVMGLEWIDGTLYVVHPPFLSAMKDTDGDGKADSRVDLVTGLGPKQPGFNGINDHLPSGIRLGMDGFLYISFGDKGIPQAVGKDGATIRAEGGGVLRVRPDGTGLEVVSTGERNPLSVALSATDEIFTYGNDDDSKKWPNSLTHHIVKGHYGYPYQFQKAPDRCLPIVAGQLGGSGTQGFCYLEDGLPADYRGDYFFCDWGLQAVFRYKLEKAGGTYKLASKSTFVGKGNVADFRPFAIAPSYDGSSLYVVDWAHTGWLNAVAKSGRLYKMTYDGPDKVKPRAAADPKAMDLEDLGHPSRNRRLEARRRLESGSMATAAVIAFLADGRKSRIGRMNALWVLDSSNHREAIRMAMGDGDAEVRLQAARSSGIRMDHAAIPGLMKLLKDPDAAVRREAAIALGKIGDKAVAPSLYAALGESDRFASWSIEHALRSLVAWDTPELTAALLDPKRRDGALRLTDEAWSVAVVDALIAAFAKTPEPSYRLKIAANLAGLHRRYPEWSGRWFGTNPLVGDFPRKTQPWSTEGMTRVVVGLGRAIDDADPAVRRLAMGGLLAAGPAAGPPFLARLDKEADPTNQQLLAAGVGQLHLAAGEKTLAAWLADANRPLAVREAALDALGQVPGRPAANARLAVLFDKKSPPELVARSLPMLGISGVLPVNDLLGFLDHASPKVRAAALDALSGRLPVPPPIRAAIVERLKDDSADVRKVAITICTTHNFREAIPPLIELAKADATRSEAAAALIAMPDPRALPVYLDAIQGRDADLRLAAESALLALRDLVAGDLEARARSGALSGPALDVVDRVLTRFVPVVAWKVIGPYPRASGQPFFGEASVDFARTHVGVEGRAIAWTDRHAQPETGRVALDDLKAGAGDRGGFGFDATNSPDLIAFAIADFDSDRDRPATLLFGSSGSLVAMLNGNWILDLNAAAGRPYRPDSNRVKVNLKRGKNRLVVQGRQGIGSWGFSVQVSEPSESLFATRPGKLGLDQLRSFAKANAGDPSRGRALFLDPRGIGCVKCHSAAGQGGAAVGPDLAGLALKYDRDEVIRSVLEPSQRIATGYQPVLVAKADGSVLTGLLKSEADATLELIDANAKVTRVNKSEIEERRAGEVSLMPVGLVDTLSREEFADLIAFLMSLK